MKTITVYLAAAGITDPAQVAAATNALQAMSTDAQSEISAANTSAQQARDQVQSEIKENQQARALAGSFRKVAEKAGVDLSSLSDTSISAERRKELSDQFSQQVLDYVSGTGEQAGDATAILKAAGFDVDAYQKAGKDKRAELAKGFAEKVAGNEVKLRTSEREKLLTEAKLDPKKAGKILGDVELTKGKTTVKDLAGKDVEVDTIGTLDDKGAFVPIANTLKEAGWTMQELAVKDGVAEQKETTDLGWLLADGQGSSAAAADDSASPLGFLTADPPADNAK